MAFIRNSRLFLLLGALSTPALLSACDLYEEGHLTDNRVQVMEERFSEEVPLSAATPGYVAEIARHYEKHGDGPVDISVTYDPASRTNTAMNAGQSADRLARALKAEGVGNVNVDTLPVQGNGDEALVLVSYMSYHAEPPKGCAPMSGYEDTDISHDEEYRLGCTIETILAKQVSRPKDLLGQGRVAETYDGRRAGNVGEVYRTGVPNKPLQGEAASE